MHYHFFTYILCIYTIIYFIDDWLLHRTELEGLFKQTNGAECKCKWKRKEKMEKKKKKKKSTVEKKNGKKKINQKECHRKLE